MAFKEPNLDPLSARLLDKQKKGASLYFADDLFDTEIQAKIDANAQMALGTTARFVAKFKPEEFFSTQNGRQIYRVRAKAT